MYVPISPPDAVGAVLFRMDQLGLSRKDLEPYLGSSSRVSEVLSRKRGLSLEMIRKLHKHLKIPLDVLVLRGLEAQATRSRADERSVIRRPKSPRAKVAAKKATRVARQR